MQRQFLQPVLRKRILRAAITLIFALCLGGAAAEEGLPLAFRQMATPVKGTVPIYEKGSTNSAEIARVEPGEQCEVIGSAEADYLHVRYGNKIGYALNNKLTVDTVQDGVPEAICDSISLVTALPTRHDSYLELQGVFTMDAPMESLFLYVWDDAQQKLERVTVKELDTPAAQLDTALLAKAIPLNRYTGGRKTLVVEGCTEKETLVLYRAPIYLFGELKEAAHITGKCKGLPASVTDNKVSTAWAPQKSQPSLTVQIPEGSDAAMMTLEWKALPASCTVELLDGNGQVLETVERAGAFYMDSVPLTNQVRTAVITPLGAGAALSTVRIYKKGYPTLFVQEWEPLPEKIDILLISTHEDDEFLFFGGSIPYYAAREDTTIGVLYMTDNGRSRYREALNGLWSAGLHQYPIFLGLKDKYSLNINRAEALWRKDDPARLLVRIMRQYKPEVLLCQDFKGEYGHGQHQYTAKLVAESFPLAADAGYDPESAEKWGTWQIKKCYVHLYEENQIRMDWNVPLDETGVITPMFRAWEGFDKNKSQIASFSMERDGVRYDNSLFGLYWTAVGPDVEKNDFMENVR